jgi:hypothetical protein
MTWPGFTQDIERCLLMFQLSSMSNNKEEAYTQEIRAVLTQNSRI